MKLPTWVYGGRYRCRDCGEVYPLMLATPEQVQVAIGGLHACRFAPHGPTKSCRGQIFDRLPEEEQDHAQPTT